MNNNNDWALILAAGDGSRLRSLTTTSAGVAVPKQFCSLTGGESLLEETVRRARAVTSGDQIVTVVAAQHREWWENPLRAMRPANVVVQPENKGTAVGLLLPLLHIVQRDPNAIVLVLPSDHFVRRKSLLIRALRQAVRLADADRQHIFLLGLVPDEVDPELGYILPAEGGAPLASPVRLFVEKPSSEIAASLVPAKALCNTFILAASAQALVGLYANSYPELLAQLMAVASRDAARTREARAALGLYPRLPTLDFCRDVLEGQEELLRVLEVPACGWSDLGTPRRVAETLRRIGTVSATIPNPTAHPSLADRQLPESCSS